MSECAYKDKCTYMTISLLLFTYKNYGTNMWALLLSAWQQGPPTCTQNLQTQGAW
jgi:hypothetical protein